MIGLINASKKFKDTKSTKFSTYAYYYILGEVTKYIRENRPIKLSNDLIKLHKNIEHARGLMTQKLGRSPSNLEVSLYLEIDEDKVNLSDIVGQNIKSLDYLIDEENDLYKFVKTEDKSTNDDILDLKVELNKLSPEEKKLIIDRYFEEMTQKETSAELGISQPKVSREEEKILKKLKTRLAI